MTAACVVCGSRQKRFLFFGRDRMHGLPGSFRVVRCAKCGCIQLDPQPLLSELAKYYPKRYHAYAHYDPESRSARFATYLYKLFFGNSRNMLAKIALLPLRHLLRGTRIIPGGRILDVGCGNGAFLHKMQAAGMKAFGVEFSPTGCREAQRLGLDVRCGTVEKQHYQSDSFDVITLNHVFEHIPDPIKTLCELKRILKPAGCIIIAVPNARSLARWLFGRYWAQLDVPRHLSIHTPHTMRLAARKTGLRLRKIRYVSSPFQFQASLAYVMNMKGVPLDKTWLGTSKLVYWLLFPLVYLVDFLHIGDVIEVYLTKK